MWKYGAKVRCFIEMRNISNRAGGVVIFLAVLILLCKAGADIVDICHIFSYAIVSIMQPFDTKIFQCLRQYFSFLPILNI